MAPPRRRPELLLLAVLIASAIGLAIVAAFGVDLRLRYLGALLAVFLASGLGLWLLCFSRRLLAGTGLVLVGLLLVQAVRVDLPGLLSGVREQHRLARLLAERAGSFDPDAALRRLAGGPGDTAGYRLDQRLSETRASGFSTREQAATGQARSQGASLGTLDFAPVRGADGAYLRNREPLSLDKQELAELQVEVRSPSATRLVLSWSSDRDAAPSEAEPAAELLLEGAATAQSFAIAAPTALAAGMSAGQTVRRVFLGPLPPEGIELRSLRFVHRREKYEGAPYGFAYERLDGERRPGIYARVGGRLTFDVEVPESSPRLSFGFARLTGSGPVTVAVPVEESGSEAVVVVSEVVEAGERWSDREVDLSAWAGRSIRLSLEATGDRNSVVFWSNPFVWSPPRERRSVLLILEDTLRADHLSTYGYSRPTSPVKDRLMADGVVFEHAFSQATKTRNSCASLMTSLYPSAVGVLDFNDRVADAHVTLAEVLRARGYSTFAWVQNGNAGFDNGLHQGFDVQVEQLEEPLRPQDVYSSRVLSRLVEASGRNVFAYLHVVDPHGPYAPPTGYRRFLGDVAEPARSVRRSELFDPEWVAEPTIEGRLALYDGEIAHNDHWLGVFLERLRAAGALDNTLVVFVSDHGEHFGEHGSFGHHPPGYRQVLHVPLLFYAPRSLGGGRRVGQPVALLDVMPTLLDWAGVDVDDLLLQGTSLLPLLTLDAGESAPRAVVSEETLSRRRRGAEVSGSVFHGRWHFLHSQDVEVPARVSGFPRLRRLLRARAFDLRQDPAESRSVKSVSWDPFLGWVVRRFLRDLETANETLRQEIVGGSAGVVPVDPEVQKQLRALGYL